MRIHLFARHLCAASALILSLATGPALADGNLQNLQHIIIVMQENHSFVNDCTPK
jgi:phospholipase C